MSADPRSAGGKARYSKLTVALLLLGSLSLTILMACTAVYSVLWAGMGTREDAAPPSTGAYVATSIGVFVYFMEAFLTSKWFVGWPLILVFGYGCYRWLGERSRARREGATAR